MLAATLIGPGCGHLHIRMLDQQNAESGGLQPSLRGLQPFTPPETEARPPL
jgi:hypothetical protein